MQQHIEQLPHALYDKLVVYKRGFDLIPDASGQRKKKPNIGAHMAEYLKSTPEDHDASSPATVHKWTLVAMHMTDNILNRIRAYPDTSKSPFTISSIYGEATWGKLKNEEERLVWMDIIEQFFLLHNHGMGKRLIPEYTLKIEPRLSLLRRGKDLWETRGTCPEDIALITQQIRLGLWDSIVNPTDDQLATPLVGELAKVPTVDIRKKRKANSLSPQPSALPISPPASDGSPVLESQSLSSPLSLDRTVEQFWTPVSLENLRASNVESKNISLRDLNEGTLSSVHGNQFKMIWAHYETLTNTDSLKWTEVLQNSMQRYLLDDGVFLVECFDLESISNVIHTVKKWNLYPLMSFFVVEAEQSPTQFPHTKERQVLLFSKHPHQSPNAIMNLEGLSKLGNSNFFTFKKDKIRGPDDTWHNGLSELEIENLDRKYSIPASAYLSILLSIGTPSASCNTMILDPKILPFRDRLIKSTCCLGMNLTIVFEQVEDTRFENRDWWFKSVIEDSNLESVLCLDSSGSKRVRESS
ncbi:hypothetical protein HK098_001805 [Nowakowskiella sp. JEL0407]|nr:hypothetical protein HK098_001805 [Nowakowskiella sp. JEL0407]